MVFPVWSETESASIATTEKAEISQVKRQSDAWTVFLFKWNCSHGIHPGGTVNKTCYKEILGRLRDSICRKRPEIWFRKNWLLIHDNAPAHRSALVQEEVAKQQVTTVLPHPQYSPDLAPCVILSLSPQESNAWTEEVMTATREAVRDLPAKMF